MPERDPIPKLTYTCPTANCTWPSFTSFAAYHTCSDLSSHIRIIKDQESSLISENSFSHNMPGARYTLVLKSYTYLELVNPIGRASSDLIRLGVVTVPTTADPL